jgi:hypothetical protein
VCVERIAFEAATRDEREPRLRRHEHRLATVRNSEWREAREAMNRDRIAAGIAEADHHSEEAQS